MQCETCHGTGQTPDPVVPKCGWCRDTGMAPWIMGDYLRTCNLCDAGKQMNEEYQRILEYYNQHNGIV
jgi:DnaJ-class molecular chaperone